MRSIGYAAILCCGLGFAAVTARAETVTVTVTGVDEDGGNLDVVLYTASDWLSHTPNIPAQHIPARQGTMTATFDNVTPGTYGVLAFHDMNMNHDLDRNFLGIPTEQFGFSNDPGYSHEPKFSEAQFTVADKPVALTIKLSD
jgi:uncharacterized protein (DUF2141 family)